MRQILDTYIRARYPIIWIVTPEEKRALQEIEALSKEQEKMLMIWSGTVGLYNQAISKKIDAAKRDALIMLTAILDSANDEPTIWVLRDFHPYLKDLNAVRRLREVAFALDASNKTVILLGPILNIPKELEKEITVVDFELPNPEQLQGMLEGIVTTLRRAKEVDVDLDRRQRESHY